MQIGERESGQFDNIVVTTRSLSFPKNLELEPKTVKNIFRLKMFHIQDFKTGIILLN